MESFDEKNNGKEDPHDGSGSRMSLFTIADLHLSLGVDKPMDVFPGWENYVERLAENGKARRYRRHRGGYFLGADYGGKPGGF